MKTDLLIIGAGPYGLAMALQAQQQGIDYQVIGKPMDFWQTHMPSGMRLRTHFDWGNEQTLNAFLEHKKLEHNHSQPVPLALFTDYVEYTRLAYELSIVPVYVQQIDYNKPIFTARLSNDTHIQAKNVVVATGCYDYKRIPQEYQTLLPRGRYWHTADCSDFSRLKGQNCLIIGGRQGAFEWAGLLQPFAQQVDIVYRHDTPEFTDSDWSWVYPYIEKTRLQPNWFRYASDAEKKQINQRFLFEGRGQLEQWLLPMIEHSNVQLWPNTTITSCEVENEEFLSINLSNGHSRRVNTVILATGYEPDIKRISWLAEGNILSQLVCNQGFACLDESLQCNIPGLYFTGINAVKDFGPFFFFVACAGIASEIIGRDLAYTHSSCVNTTASTNVLKV